MIVTLSHDLTDECCICGRRVQAFAGQTASLGRFGFALECSRCREALDAQAAVPRPRRCVACGAPTRTGRRRCVGCSDPKQTAAPARTAGTCPDCGAATTPQRRQERCRECYIAHWRSTHASPRARRPCGNGCGGSVRTNSDGTWCASCLKAKRDRERQTAQGVGVGR